MMSFEVPTIGGAAGSAAHYQLIVPGTVAQSAWGGRDPRVEQLEASVASLTREIADLRKMFEGPEARTLSDEDARAEVLAYYESHETPLYPSDVAEALSLDVSLVKRIADQLVSEGIIG